MSEKVFDQYLTCLIFPLRWVYFPIRIGRNAQWEHLFSMYFDGFFDRLPYFLKSIFYDKMFSQWEHHIPAITCNEGIQCHSTKI